ncbi:hypothetical protein ACHAXM_005617 [Skeletonema potamos]
MPMKNMRKRKKIIFLGTTCTMRSKNDNMAAQCGSKGCKKKLLLLPPEVIFGWLDEERFIDVKQLKRRRSPTTPLSSTGRETHVKTNNSHPSSEVAEDQDLERASKRSNVPLNGTTSRCRSLETTSADGRIKLYETNKLSEKRKSFKKALAMGKRIGRIREQEQQQCVAVERLVPTNDSKCRNSLLEEALSSASLSHFMQIAADQKLLKAPKKRRSNSSLFGNPIINRGQSKDVPSFWQSSDEALASASALLRDNRRRRQQQHHHQRQQIEKEKVMDMMIRNTPLSGISSRTFDALSAGPLKHVASFLTALSRVLFDVALYGIDTKPSASNSSGVADSRWDILDFGEIERSLAWSLRDRHIKAILLRIDAVDKVKRLKLTNCLKITGAGLEPLRGSRIIEQIDLSIVPNHSRGWDVYPPPQIMYHHVVPILESIIESEGCALKHLQFPKVWRNDDDALVTRYNEMLSNRGRIHCFKCDRNSHPRMVEVVVERSAVNFHQIRSRKIGRVQTNTCSNCLNHYCSMCVRNEQQGLRFCGKGCEKYYCKDCTTFNSCDVCNMEFCAGCETFTDCCTSQCNRKICSGCISENRCGKCNRTWCQCCLYNRPSESADLYFCTCDESDLCECCFGNDEESRAEYCNERDVCESCRKIGSNESSSRGGRYVVYGGDFASAPICDM